MDAYLGTRVCICGDVTPICSREARDDSVPQVLPGLPTNQHQREAGEPTTPPAPWHTPSTFPSPRRT